MFVNNFNTAWRVTWRGVLTCTSVLTGAWVANVIAFEWGLMRSNPTTTDFLLILLGLSLGVIGFVFCVGFALYHGTRAVVALQGYYHLTIARLTERAEITGINRHLLENTVVTLMLGIVDLVALAQLTGFGMSKLEVIDTNPLILTTLGALFALLVTGLAITLCLWLLVFFTMSAVVCLEWYFHEVHMAQVESDRIRFVVNAYLGTIFKKYASKAPKPGSSDPTTPEGETAPSEAATRR